MGALRVSMPSVRSRSSNRHDDLISQHALCELDVLVQPLAHGQLPLQDEDPAPDDGPHGHAECGEAERAHRVVGFDDGAGGAGRHLL